MSIQCDFVREAFFALDAPLVPSLFKSVNAVSCCRRWRTSTLSWTGSADLTSWTSRSRNRTRRKSGAHASPTLGAQFDSTSRCAPNASCPTENLFEPGQTRPDPPPLRSLQKYITHSAQTFTVSVFPTGPGQTFSPPPPRYPAVLLKEKRFFHTVSLSSNRYLLFSVPSLHPPTHPPPQKKYNALFSEPLFPAQAAVVQSPSEHRGAAAG